MTEKEQMERDAEQRRRLRENPPAMTRATVIAAAAYALLQHGDAAAGMAMASPASFVQTTRAVWAGNGYPFTDTDIREIQETLRRLVRENASQRVTAAMEAES